MPGSITSRRVSPPIPSVTYFAVRVGSEAIGGMAALDLFLFRAINRDLSNALFDLLMPAITDPEPFLVPFAGVGIALLVWGGRKGRLAVGTAPGVLFVSNAADELGQVSVQR